MFQCPKAIMGEYSGRHGIVDGHIRLLITAVVSKGSCSV